MLATILAPSMVFMVSTALNVALPAIQRDLSASGTDLIWIVNAYSLLQAAFIFLSGSFGDHYGRKRVYIVSIALFALASMVCGVTESSEVLILARALQGVGSGMMITCSLALVGAYFAHHRRSWSIAVWSAFTMLVSGAGPILGGLLAEAGLWRLIFVVNIPLSLVAVLILVIYVPESFDEEAPKELDISGAFLSTMALLLSGYFCIEGPRRGFDDPLALLSGAGAIAILPVFIWIEGHSDHPMLPLNLFRSRTFTGANTMTLLLYGAMNSVLFFLPLNLIQAQGYTESGVGFALLPMTILTVGISLIMSRVVDRYGPRIPLTIGPVILSAAFVLFALLEPASGQDTYWTTLFPAICLFGTGMGITLAETRLPLSLAPQVKTYLQSLITESFSRSISIIMLIAAGLSFLSGLLAALLIERELPFPE